jgi:outer membrane protein assembly factor BamB
MRRLQKIRGFWAAVLAALLSFSACTTIEHRSDRVPLTPLPEVLQSAPQLRSPLWQQSLGSRYRCKQQGLGLSLALGDDKIFVADCEGHVWSLDAENGQVLWKQNLKTPITAGPSVSENLVVVTTKHPAMVALNRDTGALVWEKPEHNEILTPVSFAGGNVFSHALDDTVMARRIKDGSMVWQIQNPPLNLVLRKNAQPVPLGKNVLVGFADGKLIAFKQATGEVTWIQELSVPAGHDEFQRMIDLSAAPVVSGDRIFAVNFQGKLNAFEAQSGEKIWSHPVSSFSGLAVQNNRVVVSDTQGILLALDKKTGKKQWTQDGLKGRHLSAPTTTREYVFVGDEQGQLHVLRLATGEYLTRVKVSSGAIERAPVVVGKRLFVLGQGTVVSAYYLGDLKDEAV